MKHIITLIVASVFFLNTFSQNLNGGLSSSVFSHESFFGRLTAPGQVLTREYKLNYFNLNAFVEKTRKGNTFHLAKIGYTREAITLTDQDETVYMNTIYPYRTTYKGRGSAINFSLGMGRILEFEGFSFRAAFAFMLSRNEGFSYEIENYYDSLGVEYLTTRSFYTETPYNQYYLNFPLSVHYNFWKDLSAGLQLDNGFCYSVRKITMQYLQENYNSQGTLYAKDTQTRDVNHRTFYSYFLNPAISVFYTFNSKNHR